MELLSEVGGLRMEKGFYGWMAVGVLRFRGFGDLGPLVLAIVGLGASGLIDSSGALKALSSDCDQGLGSRAYCLV